MMNIVKQLRMPKSGYEVFVMNAIQARTMYSFRFNDSMIRCTRTRCAHRLHISTAWIYLHLPIQSSEGFLGMRDALSVALLKTAATNTRQVKLLLLVLLLLLLLVTTRSTPRARVGGARCHSPEGP